MTTITLKQLAAATNVLGDNRSGALQRLMREPLPAVASFQFARRAKKIISEWDLLKEEIFKLVEKYGEEQEDSPGHWNVLPDKMEEYQAELNSLLDAEIKLDIEPIRIELLGDMSVSTDDMVVLQFLFSDK